MVGGRRICHRCIRSKLNFQQTYNGHTQAEMMNSSTEKSVTNRICTYPLTLPHWPSLSTQGYALKTRHRARTEKYSSWSISFLLLIQGNNPLKPEGGTEEATEIASRHFTSLYCIRQQFSWTVLGQKSWDKFLCRTLGLHWHGLWRLEEGQQYKERSGLKKEECRTKWQNSPAIQRCSHKAETSHGV